MIEDPRFRLAERTRREVERRYKPLPTPDEGFDPLTASRERLEHFGLPTRPDPELEPEWYALWRLAFSKPLRFVTPEFSYNANFQLRQFHMAGEMGEGRLRAGRADIPISRLEKSRNWSGAYVTPSQGRRLIHAAALWRVPMPGPRPADAEYSCSTWVGLDGYHRWVAGLPQIGTVQSVTVTGGKAGSPVTQSWWQWWVRGQNLLPVLIASVPVLPGDEVICMLRAITPDLVRFHIKNRSTPGLFTTIQVPAPTYQPQPNGPLVTASVLGTTAEWIMERPTEPGSTRLYPLPDYGTLEFADCIARSRRPLAARRQLLRSPGLIRMYETLLNPTRAAVISVPRKLDRRTAEVRYQQR